MSFAGATYPIAVDVSDQDLCAVQLRPDRRGLAIRDMAHRRLDKPVADVVASADLLDSAVRDLLGSGRFRGADVVAHLPLGSVVSFPVRFQTQKKETPEEAMVREATKPLPFPIQEAVLDYPSIRHPTSGSTEPSEALIVAIRREEANRVMSAFARSGRRVAAIDFATSALLRLHATLCTEPSAPIILCNVSRTQTVISGVAGDCILAQRNVAWGLQVLTDKILASMDLAGEDDNALFLLREYGLMHDTRVGVGQAVPSASEADAESADIQRAVCRIIGPLTEALIYEIHSLTAYAKAASRNVSFQSLFLYGMASGVRNLDGYVESRLGMPTTTINPMARIPSSDVSIPAGAGDGSCFSLALGLALRKLS